MGHNEKMNALMDALGYHFRDPSLLRQALTHPSYGSPDNQRLEFLGDAVLQYLMSDLLFAKHPGDQEGSLTHRRALLVCEAALSQVARSLKVGDALLMDAGEEMTGGRDKSGALGDAMEAILAAVYLDGGLEEARSVIRRNWPDEKDVHRPMQDSKSALQEYLQRDGSASPTYETIDSYGPPHAPTFVALVRHLGRELARGEGRTKKLAEQAAALTALNLLKQQDAGK